MSDRAEFRRLALRASKIDGRAIEGTVVRYGDTADIGGFREKFQAGALTPRPGATLNLQHERSLLLARVGAGLEFHDDEHRMAMRATLPATRLADDVLEGIRAGLYGGLSLEFRARDERWPERDLRVVTRADLNGVAIVDTPAYPEAQLAEARAAAMLGRRRFDMLWLPLA